MDAPVEVLLALGWLSSKIFVHGRFAHGFDGLHGNYWGADENRLQQELRSPKGMSFTAKHSTGGRLQSPKSGFALTVRIAESC
jgi:hypothetical protein